MAVISPLTMASDDKSPDDVESDPSGEDTLENATTEVCNELDDTSVVSPSPVLELSQEEDNLRRDNNGENGNAWKGDLWSQEDVRTFLSVL